MKKLLVLSLAAGLMSLGGLLTPFARAAAPVVISEIMYHPVEEPAFNADGTPVMELYEDVHEFVELHNHGAQRVDLTGWKITGGIDFSFPAGAAMEPGAFLVVAKHPARLAAVSQYGLSAASLYGPYDGQLSNDGETIRVEDFNGFTVDSVTYSARFPWPISADALGADEEWTGIRLLDYQYRGRSLERVSDRWPSDDPANWLASPLPGNPGPGRPSAVQALVPPPIVMNLFVAQAADGQPLIRAGQSVRIDCLFSAPHDLRNVALDYFVDDINRTNEVPVAAPMLIVGNPGEGRFQVELPGQSNRSPVRYRIRADRGYGDEVVSPRRDDPFGWHAYFVTPVRAGTNVTYDLFISTRGLQRLSTNITQNPPRTTNPDPPGTPRKSWNATEPAVFVFNGVVWDVQMRHHGSRYRRTPSRQSYKLLFPRHSPFKGLTSVFLTDKDNLTEAGHTLVRAVGLPSSRTQWIDLYLNSNARLRRLEQEEYEGRLLERYHREQARRHPDLPTDLPGELFKSQGVFSFGGPGGGGTIPAEGPYGPGDGRQLPARTSRTDPNLVYWTPLQRYEWTYSLQNNGWRGHTAFKEMLDALWTAREGRTGALTSNQVAQVRDYYAARWHLEDMLTYLAVSNWMVPWDDTIHNTFLWQHRDGRWSMLPWDFDSVMTGQPASASIFIGSGQGPGGGSNYFKISFVGAYREEFKQRMWWLNNTVLHPENISALGLTSIRSWSNSRFNSVNTQCGLGVFLRPAKPTNEFPAAGQRVAGLAALRASAYVHTSNPAPVHHSTTWQIRAAKGTWETPLFQRTTTNELTALAVPFAELNLGETYFWRCIYTDATGRPSLASAETSFVYAADPLQAGEVFLSELMADNRSTLANAGRYPDWVELHNPSDEPRSLAGWSLTDDLLEPTKFVFPAGAVIPARSHLVVWCDNRTAAPGLHTGFNLSADGEVLGLFAPTEDGPRLKDVVTFGRQLADLSIGRVVDAAGAAGEWTLNRPTPGAANEAQPLGSARQLRFNEWMARPSSGNDWFELVNPEPLPVALGGLSLTDDFSAPRKSPLPPLSFIAARGFAYFDADGDSEAGASHANFRLNACGGSLALFSAEGAAIDIVQYNLQEPGRAEGRLPDAAPTAYRFTGPPTPGYSNVIDRDNDGLPDEYEVAHALNPGLFADAAQDADADGLSNLVEYRAGTDPRDPASALRLELAAERGALFQFTATPGHSYTVLYKDALEASAWEKLLDLEAQPTTRVIQITDPATQTQVQRYYRLVTPRQP